MTKSEKLAAADALEWAGRYDVSKVEIFTRAFELRTESAAMPDQSARISELEGLLVSAEKLFRAAGGTPLADQIRAALEMTK
jgi:hypothetical protein